MRRIGQPPVLGELIGGILLGPSLLGKIAPELFTSVFQQHQSLDVFSRVGLVLLLLLTGLETDVRVLRHLGRAAFMASFFGLVIPFGCGYLLGANLDSRFVPDENMRLPLSLFLATAMAVSAMPVIAKILLDLKMMKRNLGLVILSAAVVDDTIGWLILAGISSLVGGMAGSGWFAQTVHHVQVNLGLPVAVKHEQAGLIWSVIWLVGFLLFARYVLYPLMRRVLPAAEHFLRIPGGELVLVLVVTFFCAAFTEGLHIHAVFGAFLAGMVFRQCPTLSRENLHQLESVTMSLFAPLFFGSIGLRADFFQVRSIGFPLAVCGIAISTKIVGCYIGGLLGRMPPWEALGIGLGMSARGAVGLIVAQIGLNMGILTQELFAVLVLMTIVTTVLAPITMKAIAHKIPLSEEEKLREKSGPEGFIPAMPLKILIPAGGGENALRGCHVATHLCSRDGDRCMALYIEKDRASWWQRLWGTPSASGAPSGVSTRLANPAQYLDRLKSFSAGNRLNVHRTGTNLTVLETILEEAQKGYHFLFIGASGETHPVHDPFVRSVVRSAPCHLVVSCGGSTTPLPTSENGQTLAFRRILVSTNGGYFSDAAFELAARYAESSGAHLTVLYVVEGQERNPLLPAAAMSSGNEHVQDLMRVTLREEFAARFKYPERLDCHVRESESVIQGLLDETAGGTYDLAVVGVEKKALVERLNLGQDIEVAVEQAPCALMLVIPKIGG